MLRKNRETGGFERLVDGKWVPAPDVEDTGDLGDATAERRPSAVGVAEEAAEHDRVQWDQVEKLFAEDQDAAGSGATGSAAGGDLAVPIAGPDAGPGEVVQVPEGPGSDGQGVAADAQVGSEPADAGSAELGIDEIPGLTVADKRGGVTGQRGVLQRLRDRRRVGGRNSHRNAKSESGRLTGQKSTDRTPPSGRSVHRVEVAEAAAKPRGPAVRDGTEARQLARQRAKKSAEPSGRISTKPAPEIISGQARWVRDLFEAHFRSSRTLELRHMPIGKSGKNRMKMSRADFSIGWLVLLEAARRDPSILHIKELES
jgi:hypothetical protein